MVKETTVVVEAKESGAGIFSPPLPSSPLLPPMPSLIRPSVSPTFLSLPISFVPFPSLPLSPCALSTSTQQGTHPPVFPQASSGVGPAESRRQTHRSSVESRGMSSPSRIQKGVIP